jgi:hypothetical protein
MRKWIWGIPAFFYLAFVFWYTDFGGPLREDEIAGYLAKFEAQGFSDEDEFLARVRGFMATDTGRQFQMVNVIDYDQDPPDVEGAAPGESAEQLMGRYMEHMFRELFRRACHPTVMGVAAHRAMDLVGVDALERPDEWDMAAFMRYRSRRTFMEIVTIPETRGRHEFKVAAIEKTIADPVETRIHLGDPRVSLGLGLFALASLLDLALYRRGA